MAVAGISAAILWVLVVIQCVRMALGRGGRDAGKELMIVVIFACMATIFAWAMSMAGQD